MNQQNQTGQQTPSNKPPYELTILMPCLDEAETLEICIGKARQSLTDLGIEGEVLISDNGSTDGSQEIAVRCGARVVNAPPDMVGLCKPELRQRTANTSSWEMLTTAMISATWNPSC